MIRRVLATALFAGATLVSSAACFAQSAATLPDSPAYKGDIRRSPDGKLIAVEPSPSAAQPQAKESAAPVTLVVGPNEAIRTITEAAKAARDGDIVEIRPGEYRGQTAVWTQSNLVIRGSGQRPVLIADGKSAEGKALWVLRGGNVRIENIEFRGVRVKDGNGAGIRFERGHLTVHRCAFIDNEMGILTNNTQDLTLTVSDSEFADAARHNVDVHHLLYVGAIGKFVLTGSRFTNGYRGHLVKSRARENDIRYNLLVDGTGGQASYELELPNGGLAYVIGNIFQKSETADNSVLVAYGAEGPRWKDNALYLAHNTLINDRHAGAFLKLSTERFSTAIEGWVINNLTVGNGDLFPPAHGRFEGNLSASRRDLVDYAGIPSRLKPDSSLRGKVRAPGSANGVDLMPSAEFAPPVGQRRIHPGSQLAPGALQ